MAKNKIIIISSEFPPGPGGIGQHAFSMAKALSSRFNVVILANQDYCSLEDKKRFLHDEVSGAFELNLFVSRKVLLYPIGRVIQAIRFVQSYKPDLVIVSGMFPLWIGGVIKTLFRKVKVRAFIHGTEITKKDNWRDRINRWTLGNVDCVYPVSHYTKSLLPTNVKQGDITVIPNGIDEELIQKAESKGTETLSLKGNPKILTVGNVSLRKGQHRVIKALPILRQDYPDIHYHIVGLPSEKHKMEEIAAEHNVADCITFHGRVDRERLYDFYRQSDVFMMLSENQKDGDVEGFGIAILEANTFGLPAIGALGCGIEDAISPNSGQLVDGNDAQAILDSLKVLLRSYESFSAGAKKWANQHRWSELVKKIDL